MSDRTTRQTLKLLATSIINKLENRKYIEIDSSSRNVLQDKLSVLLSRSVLTDEDLTDRIRKDISKVSDEIQDQNLTETAAFQSRKKLLKEEIGEHEIRGLYFQKTVRNVVIEIAKFLMSTEEVVEVYESDEIIHRIVIDTIQNFDPSKMA